MILISGSSAREIVDLQQGDYEEMDQLAVAKTVARRRSVCCTQKDIGIGMAGRSALRCPVVRVASI